MIVIYLDQSDFSYFSTCGDEEPFKTLRAKLVDLKNSGAVQLVYSYVHVAEITHVDRRYSHFARERAIQLRELCGKSVVDQPINVWSAEIQKSELGERLTRNEVIRLDGSWLPGFDISGVFQHYKPLERTINQSRQRQRAYKRSVSDFLERSWADIQKRVPACPLEIKPLIEAWMFGEFSGVELEEKITEHFYDPVRAIDAKKINKNPFGDLRSQIDDLGDSFTQTYAAIAETFASYINKFDELKRHAPTLGDISDRSVQLILSEALQKQRRVISQQFHYFKNCSDQEIDIVLSRCPGFGLMMDYKDRRFLDIQDAALSRKTAKRSNRPNDFRSDASDGLHLTYAPYVDYFRCDTDTYNLLKRTHPEISERCYPTPQALLSAISKI